MKKYKDLKNKSEIYIIFLYLLVTGSILASFSQLISFKYRSGNFNFGEIILIMFNDSYTGYFTFPFLLGFILMLQSPVEQNIFFTLTRYTNRKEFYKVKHTKVIKSLLAYVACICLFCLIVGIGSSKFGFNISQTTKEFANIYLLGNFETNNLILEIFKLVSLEALLLYFFALVHGFLIQFRIPQALVFVIYTSLLIIAAGMSLGFFGDEIKDFSLFSLASSINGRGIKFIYRLGVLTGIDLILLILNFKIFENKDINLPKGSKEYQNE
ncbi:hypothetical protein K8P03_00195 [Anaerococcus murdochii]|uniref:ABC transporter permease n=2 Tax=Anaerococcus murdochii TaxID=411577 RepID=A0ABS7SW61_9FIRM|nr:hypothetical protein [Anaerococcus murdochii]